MASCNLQAQYLSESCKSLIAGLNALELQHNQSKALQIDLEKDLRSKDNEVGTCVACTTPTPLYRVYYTSKLGCLCSSGCGFSRAASDMGHPFLCHLGPCQLSIAGVIPEQPVLSWY